MLNLIHILKHIQRLRLKALVLKRTHRLDLIARAQYLEAYASGFETCLGRLGLHPNQSLYAQTSAGKEV